MFCDVSEEVIVQMFCKYFFADGLRVVYEPITTTRNKSYPSYEFVANKPFPQRLVPFRDGVYEQIRLLVPSNIDLNDETRDRPQDMSSPREPQEREDTANYLAFDSSSIIAQI